METDRKARRRVENMTPEKVEAVREYGLAYYHQHKDRLNQQKIKRQRRKVLESIGVRVDADGVPVGIVTGSMVMSLPIVEGV